jgi:hypothetical protein
MLVTGWCRGARNKDGPASECFTIQVQKCAKKVVSRVDLRVDRDYSVDPPRRLRLPPASD